MSEHLHPIPNQANIVEASGGGQPEKHGASLSDGLYEASYTTADIAARHDDLVGELAPAHIVVDEDTPPGSYVLEHMFSQLHVIDTDKHKTHIGRLLAASAGRVKHEQDSGNYMDYLDEVFDVLEQNADTNVSRLIELFRLHASNPSPFIDAKTLYGTMLLLDQREKPTLRVVR